MILKEFFVEIEIAFFVNEEVCLSISNKIII